MKSILLIVFGCISVLFSCQPLIVFDVPQPENCSALSRIPKNIQGLFVNQKLTDTLFIDGDKIILHMTYYEVMLKGDLDSNYSLIDSTLINHNTDEKENVMISGDSIISRSNDIDTMFSISNRNILKKYKGHYFLNTQYKENQWEVLDLQYTKNRIMISEINTPEEIELLKAVTESNNDSLNVFRPSKKQFKEFIKEGGYGAGDIYYRIK